MTNLLASLNQIVVLSGDQTVIGMTSNLLDNQARLVASDLEDWQAKVRSHPGSIGLLEINIENGDLKAKLIAASAIIQNCGASIVLGFMPASQFHSNREILTAGFAAIFTSMKDRDRLLEMATKHFNSAPKRELGIEEAVNHNLPWQPLNHRTRT